MAKRGNIEVLPDPVSSFHTRNRAKQLIDFKGIRFKGKIRPTDIDCVNGESVSASLDFGDGKRGFVFYEVKYGNSGMDTGQRRHLTALADNLSSPALVLQVYHTVEDTDEDVMLKDCIVSRAYFRGRWFDAYNGKTALEVTRMFVEKYCPEYLLGE